MKKKIKDIKVVGPEDKLIILAEDMPMTHMDHLAKRVSEFLKSKDKKSLVVSGLKIYILRKGAHISLADILERNL